MCISFSVADYPVSSTDKLVPSSAGGAVLLLRALLPPCTVTPAYRQSSTHVPAGGPALQLQPQLSSALTLLRPLIVRAHRQP